MDKEPTVEEAFETFRQTSKQVLYDTRDCLNRPVNELVSEQEKNPFSSQLVHEPMPTRPMSIQEHKNFHKMNKRQTVRPKEQIVGHNDMSNHFIEMPFESQLFHLNQFEELEHKKPVEEVVKVHEVYKHDNDPQCLDEVIRNYLATHTTHVEPVESFVKRNVTMMNFYFKRNLMMNFLSSVKRQVLRSRICYPLIWRK